MKYATGMETCTKIHFFVYLQPSVNNLAILTLQFDDVIVKTIYSRSYYTALA